MTDSAVRYTHTNFPHLSSPSVEVAKIRSVVKFVKVIHEISMFMLVPYKWRMNWNRQSIALELILQFVKRYKRPSPLHLAWKEQLNVQDPYSWPRVTRQVQLSRTRVTSKLTGMVRLKILYLRWKVSSTAIAPLCANQTRKCGGGPFGHYNSSHDRVFAYACSGAVTRTRNTKKENIARI